MLPKHCFLWIRTKTENSPKTNCDRNSVDAAAKVDAAMAHRHDVMAREAEEEKAGVVVKVVDRVKAARADVQATQASSSTES